MVLDIAFTRPEYATSFLLASPDTQIAPAILWDLRLTICEQLLADERIRTDMDRSTDGGWLNFRRAVVNMLEKAVSDEEQNAPEEFLTRVRDILIILVDDPDPDLENDRPKEGWFGHNDPLTVAINHIRPEALLSLIKYSSVIATHDEDQKPKGFGPARFEPTVKDALTRKVDWHSDPSLALHSVFGRELPILSWLDLEWVKARLDDIFPRVKMKNPHRFSSPLGTLM